MSAAHRQFIESTVNTSGVVIFSGTYCPFCAKAKAAIQKLGVDFQAVELDVVENGDAIKAELANMTGQRTVPNIFVNGTRIGGCDDTLAAIQSGQFQTLLNGR